MAIDKITGQLVDIKLGVSEFNTIKNIDKNFDVVGKAVDDIIDQVGSVSGKLEERVEAIEGNYVEKIPSGTKTSQEIQGDVVIAPKSPAVAGGVNGGGNITVMGNATIAGNLVVQGTETIIDTQNLEVQDAFITINKGAGALASLLAGIGIITAPASGTNQSAYGIAYDATDKAVKLGLGKINTTTGKFTFDANEGNPIVVRGALVNNNLIKWDAANFKVVDTGISATNIATVNGNNTFTGDNKFTSEVEFTDGLKATNLSGESVEVNGESIIFNNDEGGSVTLTPTYATNDVITLQLPAKSGVLSTIDDITTAISNLNLSDDYVTVAGPQTITGAKTFSAATSFGANVSIEGALTTNSNITVKNANPIIFENTGGFAALTAAQGWAGNKTFYLPKIDEATATLATEAFATNAALEQAKNNTWRPIEVISAEGEKIWDIPRTLNSAPFRIQAGTNITFRKGGDITGDKVYIDASSTEYLVFTDTVNGLVPAPTAAKATSKHYLAGDKSWQELPKPKVTVETIATTDTAKWATISYGGASYNALKFAATETILDVYNVGTQYDAKIVAPSVMDASNIYFLINESTEAKVSVKVRKLVVE